MVNQNYMVDFLSRVQPAQGEVKKAGLQKDNKMQFPEFREILSNTMDKPYSRQSQPSQQVKRGDNREFDRDTNQKAQFKNFNEASENTKKMDSGPKEKAAASSGNTRKVVNEEVKAKKTVESKEEAVMENLAQVLGLNKDDLMTLLGALNIKPEDLADPSKASEIVDKLSGIMGLNGDQKNTLARIINTVSNQVEEQYAKLGNENSDTILEKPLSDGSEAKAKRTEIEVVKEPSVEFQDMMARMKVRLDEIRSRLESDPGALAKEIAQNLEELVKDGIPDDIKAKIAMNNNDSGKSDYEEGNSIPGQEEKLEANVVKKVDEEPKADIRKDTSDKEDKSNEGIVKAEAKTDKLAAEVNNSSEAPEFNNLITANANKTHAPAETIKVQKEAAVSKNEIINQVVEKAKVVISGDKSEMVMDLKPDSLGKLSLKVVTERGMVVAHFVAESQQVKQIIETNMQLLKDTLEKQGMAVQGFSVSVGQDSQKEFNKGEWSRESRKANNAKISAAGGIKVGASEVFENEKKINAYNWSDSSINLTA